MVRGAGEQALVSLRGHHPRAGAGEPSGAAGTPEHERRRRAVPAGVPAALRCLRVGRLRQAGDGALHRLLQPRLRGEPGGGGKFRYPLYRRPADLVSDPITGEVKGRQTPDGQIRPWPARKEIERSGMFRGSELIWLADPLDAYIVHVNGSARIALKEGGIMHVGYAGKTDRPYKGLGTLLVERKHLKKEGLSLTAIRNFYVKNPEVVKELILENESYVFFTEYEGAEWPAGSIGVPVTDLASLATDKKIFPRGGLVLFDTKYTAKGQKADLIRFALDQDTGGAIRAPGRADIYFGVGPSPELLAGAQYNEGRLFYFFLKSHTVP
ncbi:MAG: hypothetical protein HC813_04105 [Planctomycetes bacterium]|nr:hypothetical protein [Planctomycetota bacterium]